MTRHQELVREVLVACNRLPGVFLFPVDVARVPGWKRTRGMTGTSDLLGWRSWCGLHRVFPGDAGRTLCTANLGAHVGDVTARFVAIEVKVLPDRPTREQQAFLDKVREAGGIALVAYDVMTAVEALR